MNNTNCQQPWKANTSRTFAEAGPQQRSNNLHPKKPTEEIDFRCEFDLPKFCDLR